jgi:predicted nucleotidyltransferase
MTTLAQATLTDPERKTLDRFVQLLQEELGDELRSVWLYGSRARGERAREESDIDLIVVAEHAGPEGRAFISHRLYKAAAEEGASPAFFSLQVYDSAHVARRRDIRSFFFQEVDRDKIVLAGEP